MLYHMTLGRCSLQEGVSRLVTSHDDISICIYLITHFDLKFLNIKIASVRTKLNALETLNKTEELQIA